jgi:hypothetical protein
MCLNYEKTVSVSGIHAYTKYTKYIFLISDKYL